MSASHINLVLAQIKLQGWISRGESEKSYAYCDLGELLNPEAHQKLCTIFLYLTKVIVCHGNVSAQS